MRLLKKLLILLVLLGIGYAIYDCGILEYLSLDGLKSQKDKLDILYQENQIQFILGFFSVYVLLTAFSVPGATIMTLAGGAFFGLWTGFAIVSFASTIGATLAFLISRFFLREYVSSKFSSSLQNLNAGIEKEGGFYLFSLRLLPIFPFFMINLVMGVTSIKVSTFYIVSQLGMLAGTFVYVNAGQELSEIHSLKDIMSFDLFFAFALLGLFPLIAKKMMNMINTRKVYRGYKKPKSFDFNMIAIGGGAAGLVTSYISAAVGAKVALIERHKMGGDCLNTGCVPSKAILKSAKVAHHMKQASKYGIEDVDVKVNFKKVMNRVHDVISKIEPHDSVERYSELGVDCISGEAKILSPWEVEVNGKVYTTKNITIATGARPFVPPIPGIENANALISDNLWQLDELPRRLTILGAGPIGLEMAQAFQRLGSQVSVIEMGPQIMGKEDLDISLIVKDNLENEGVKFYLNHKAVKFTNNTVECEYNNSTVQVEFDRVLVAVGRAANVKGFGLEDLDINLNRNNTIEVNEYLQTKYPNIFAAGDVAGPYQLTHMASHQAWYCAVNGLFGSFKKFKVDYSVVPWVTYTDPEVSHVGASENDLINSKTPYEVVKYDVSDLDRAIADSEAKGVVKILLKKGTDRILGATIVSQSAGELIIEFVSAMKQGFGLEAILGTIHSYPTMNEANKYAAGEWKRANKPEKLLSFVRKFHTWKRS